MIPYFSIFGKVNFLKAEEDWSYLEKIVSFWRKNIRYHMHYSGKGAKQL